MKFRIKHASFLLSLVILTSPLLPGCSSTGSQRAEKTTATMNSVDADIRAAVVQIDATNSALENLVKPGQPDTKAAFKTYSDNVAKMESAGAKLTKHTDEMSARGQDYFDEWKKQGDTYTNPQIQQLSEQRRSDLNAVFRRVSDSSIGVKGALTSYMSDIREIQTFLSTDLTAKGIEAITPVAQKAMRDGDSLKDAITPVISTLEEARNEMAQGSAK